MTKSQDIRWDIRSRIMPKGWNSKKVIAEMKNRRSAIGETYSESESNFSGKLSRGTLTYRDVLDIADIIGYDIVWVDKEDDECGDD